jgi:hypothetical protein
MISTIALAIVLVTLLTFVVAQFATAPKAAVISVTGSQGVNSATQSYIAWAETAEAEASTANSASSSYTAWAKAAEAEASTMNSATRSYLAQAKAVACSVDTVYGPNLDSATRSYITWGLASDFGASCL